jgi:hypothetical protein
MMHVDRRADGHRMKVEFGPHRGEAAKQFAEKAQAAGHRVEHSEKYLGAGGRYRYNEVAVHISNPAGQEKQVAPKSLQTGAKGGSFYVTATGRKIYKKQ